MCKWKEENFRKRQKEEMEVLISSFTTLWTQDAVLLTNCWSNDIAARLKAEDMAGNKHLILIFEHITKWKSQFMHSNTIYHINKNKFWVYVWIDDLCSNFLFSLSCEHTFLCLSYGSKLYCKGSYDFVRSCLNIKRFLKQFLGFYL